MNWQLGWSRQAIDQLAQIWQDSTDKDAISLAVARIDRKLVGNPTEFGESRGLNQRVAFEPPLTVTFYVETRMSLVTVVWVHMPASR